jgi:hypothetical protein
MITFGDFTPDQPALAAGSTVANNVVPALNSYRPFNAPVTYASGASSTLNGVFSSRALNGTVNVFAADLTKLYRIQSSALADVSKSGGYSTASGDKFRFATFGNLVIATNYANAPQKWTLGSSSVFADLGGTPPKAKYITTVRDFVVFGYTNDTTDGERANRVWFSALGNAEDYVPSATTQADYQDIYDAGTVMGLAGGEYGVVLLERGIARMSYAGTPLIFQFDMVERGRGCVAAGSVAQVGSAVFYLADDGFYVFDGQKSTPIGAEKVDRYFYTDVDLGYLSSMSSAVDVINKLVVWSYRSVNASANDKLIIYNWQTAKWSTADSAVNALAAARTTSLTLEDLDALYTSMDAMTTSFDSGVFNGGKLFLAGVAGTSIVSFTGIPLTGVIETNEFMPNVGGRSTITQVRPYVQGGSVSVAVASRTTTADPYTFGAAASTSTDGMAPVRSNGRFHRVRATLSGTWSHAMGIDVKSTNAGLR